MKLVKYLQEVRLELKKVTWPTREQSIKMTLIVLGASLVVGLYIGGLDYLFTNLLGFVLR